MADRIQLLVTHYMPLDGQDQIVLPASVVDVPNAGAYPFAIKLAEVAGSLGPRNTPSSVLISRNLKNKLNLIGGRKAKR